MKRSRFVVPAFLLFALACAPAFAEYNVNFILGGRSMSDSDHWEPFDSQAAFGVNVDFGGKGWPVQLCGGLHSSAKEETINGNDVTATVAELSFGVMKLWKAGNGGMTRPYVGGGIAAVTAEFEQGGYSVDDTSAGFYVHGGVFWRLGSRFNIGFDARYVGGTSIEFFGIDGDADYAQAGLVLGWGTPAAR